MNQTDRPNADAASATDKSKVMKIIAKAGKKALDDEQLDMVSGGGGGLWMISGDPECPDCPGTKMNRYCEEGNLITYICPICHNTITLFDQG